MKEEKYTVLQVDDHALFRNGLKLLLNSHPRFRVVGEAATGREMLGWLEQAERLPDVVLLDIAMPDMNGIEAAAEALRRWPELRIITLSMYGEEDYYFKMVSQGVKGFLLKNWILRRSTLRSKRCWRAGRTFRRSCCSTW